MKEYFKNDYRSVYNAIKFVTNDKAPDWAIFVWYILLLPFGLILLPFAKLYMWWLLRNLK